METFVALVDKVQIPIKLTFIFYGTTFNTDFCILKKEFCLLQKSYLKDLDIL